MAERRARKDKKDNRNSWNGSSTNFTQNNYNSNNHHGSSGGGLKYNPKRDSPNNAVRAPSTNNKDNGKDPKSTSNIGSYVNEGPPQFVGPVSYAPYYHPPTGFQPYDAAYEHSQAFMHTYGGVYSQNGKGVVFGLVV